MVYFFLRTPRFPILLDTGTKLLVLRTAAECDRFLEGLQGSSVVMPVIDAAVVGFDYYPAQHAITPLTLKKVWTKAEIVALYNERKPADAPPYAPTLATRKLPDVLADVMDRVRPRKTR